MDELKHDIDSSRYAQLLSRYCRALQGDDTANVNRHYNFLRQHTSDFVEKRMWGARPARWVGGIGWVEGKGWQHSSPPIERISHDQIMIGNKIYLLIGQRTESGTVPDEPSEEWHNNILKLYPEGDSPLTRLVNQIKEKENKMTLKLVQYYVVDPDPRLPEYMHILVEGTAMIRDEIEFKVNLNLPHLLKQHNELRGTVEPDENVLNINAGQLVLKKEMLKPIPIRKLRIIINTIEEWMCE